MLRPQEYVSLADALEEWREKAARRYALGGGARLMMVRRHAAELVR